MLIPEPAGISTSAGSFSNPARVAQRQADRCCGESPWRRATSDTTAPGAKDSATIRPLISSLQHRRPTAPRDFEASTTSPTIDANRFVQDEPHVAGQPAGYNVGPDDRLRRTEASTMSDEWGGTPAMGGWDWLRRRDNAVWRLGFSDRMRSAWRVADTIGRISGKSAFDARRCAEHEHL